MNLLSRLPKDWPVPDVDALSHCQRVAGGLIERLVESDGLYFDQVMEYLLYEPGLGYYSAGAQKFGEGGDFITAPESSSLFSFTVARQLVQAMDATAMQIMEVGAGSGVMAADILLELERLEFLPERYLILERSADLVERQRKTMAQKAPRLVERVEWLSQWPEQFDGAVVANELFDAFAVSRFKWQNGEVFENLVQFVDGDFVEAYVPARPEVVEHVQALAQDNGPWPEPYESEVCLGLKDWIDGFAAATGKVIALFIDYGYNQGDYYHPHRSSGTLMCHYRHRAHGDVFLLPGLQDLTSHVDFSLLAKCAHDHGFQVLGYAPQSHFLMSAGIGDIMMSRVEGDVEAQIRFAQQIKTLTLPGEMGERFKVIALGTVMPNERLIGFSMLDQTVRL